MAGLSRFNRYMLIGLVAAGCIGAAPLAHAGKGYQGLIAPSSEDDNAGGSATGTESDDASSIPVLTLSPNAKAGKNSLIAPSIAEPAEDTASSDSNSDDNISPMPGSRIKDPKYASVLRYKKGSVKGPAVSYANVSQPKMNGRSAMEEVVSRDIKRAMDNLNDKETPRKEREAQAKRAYSSLSKLADGLRSKQRVPDDTYRRMGVSETYIADERHSIAVSIERLDSALAILKPYE